MKQAYVHKAELLFSRIIRRRSILPLGFIAEKPVLINPLNRLSVRSMAIRVDIGHGHYNSPDYFKQSHSYEDDSDIDKRLVKSVSPLQRRKADNEFERFQKITCRILSLDSLPESTTTSTALLNEVRVTLHYWITRWHFFFHPILAIAPTPVQLVSSDLESMTQLQEYQLSDYGIKQAEKLLDWIIQMDTNFPQHQIVNKTLAIDKNAAFVNLIDSCLLSCNAQEHHNASTDHTAHSHQYTDNNPSFTENHLTMQPSTILDITTLDSRKTHTERGRFVASNSSKNIHVKTWFNALLTVGRLLDKMNRLHLQQSNELYMDTHAAVSTLNILSKLCTLMLKTLNIKDSSKDSNDILTAQVNWKTLTPDGHQLPSIFSFTCIRDILSQMESLLQSMENSSADGSLKPDEWSYNTVIATFSRLNISPDARERADWYLRRMERTEDEDLGRISTDPDNKYPRTAVYADAATYNSVIHAFSSAQPRIRNKPDTTTDDSSRYAAEILTRMERRFEYTKRESVRPNTISYGTVLNGMANAGNAAEAERILDSMIRRSDTSVEPNLICFNTCISAWGKSGQPRAADHAQALLKQLEELSNSLGREDLRPDIISYSGVITAIAKSGSADSAHRSETILRRLMEKYNAGEERLRPDLITLNSVLGAWATQHKSILNNKSRIKGDESEFVRRAESLFEEMHSLKYICPCIISYNIMLDMYSRIPDLRKAESLFKTMIERDKNQSTLSIDPDIISYNALLVAMVNDIDNKSIKRAKNLLLAMDGDSYPSDVSHLKSSIKPDIASYNIVLGGIASQNPNQAEDFLRYMKRRYKEERSLIRPNRISFNICIDAYGKHGLVSRAEDLLHEMIELSKEWNDPGMMPDVITLTSVIVAITNSGEIDAPNRAEKFLRQMETYDACVPNRITFNNIINAWAKIGSPDRAKEILLRMEELSRQGVEDIAPDEISFSTVINAYAQKGQVQNAEKVFSMMEDRFSSGESRFRPNAITYSSLMNAWAKSGEKDAAERTQLILEKMERNYAFGKSDVAPNEQCYNTVINALAKSDDPNKARKCLEIVKRMEKPSMPGIPTIQPSVITFSTIINACAHTKGTPEQCSEAFQVARICLKEVLTGRYGQANNIVFGTFLFACSKLVKAGDERDRLIVTVFLECCKRGLLDEKSFTNVKRSLSREQWKKLVSTIPSKPHLKFSEIPEEWSKNVSKISPVVVRRAEGGIYG